MLSWKIEWADIVRSSHHQGQVQAGLQEPITCARGWISTRPELRSPRIVVVLRAHGDGSLPLIEAQSLQQVLDRNQRVLDQELNFNSERVATPGRGPVSVALH